MIDFTKFNAKTGELIAWNQTSHAELIPSQLNVGEAAALGKHESKETLFLSGSAIYKSEDENFYIIEELQKNKEIERVQNATQI